MPERRHPPRGRPAATTDSSRARVLLEGLNMFTELVSQALEHGATEVSRSLQVPLRPGRPGAGGRTGVLDLGLRARTWDAAAGSDGAPRPLGRETVAPPSRIREPLVDVFDEGAEIIVAAEVPGCGIADVEVAVDAGGRGLTITASGARGYRRHLALPALVNPDWMEKACNNGMLEVRLGKLDRAAGGAS